MLSLTSPPLSYEISYFDIQTDSCLLTLTAIVVVFVLCNAVKMVASLYEMITLERLAVCRSDTNSFGLPLWEVILNMLGMWQRARLLSEGPRF
jgi:hypothetical protein